jgi:hypothetical protein
MTGRTGQAKYRTTAVKYVECISFRATDPGDLPAERTFVELQVGIYTS